MNTTPEIIDRARKMRKEPTEEENKLWHILLKHIKPRFIRQKTIGYYIVDFYCAKAGLVVELDGSQHYEPEEMEKDLLRTRFLEDCGLTVLRIPNNAVSQNFSGVCEAIDLAVRESLSQLR